MGEKRSDLFSRGRSGAKYNERLVRAPRPASATFEQEECRTITLEEKKNNPPNCKLSTRSSGLGS